MFRRYGLLGILLILFVELNFFLEIQPFAHWYFPIIWLGYILLVDALVYRIKQRSLLMNNFKQFLMLCIVSALFWWIFEFINFHLGNWDYANSNGTTSLANGIFMATLSFTTVLPAIVETIHLLEALHLEKNFFYQKHIHVTKSLIHSMAYTGFVCFFLVFFLPKFAFPLIWLALFLLLDPLNYLHGAPSLLRHLQQG